MSPNWIPLARARPRARPSRTPPSPRTAASSTCPGRAARPSLLPPESFEGGRRDRSMDSGLVDPLTPVRDLTPPAPERDSAPVSTGGERTYVVRAGETLSEISERELGTWKRWKEILAVNEGLDPRRLAAGTKIRLPGGARTPDTVARPEPKPRPHQPEPTARTAGGSYVIRSGDVLSVVAQRELGSSKRWREILDLNPGLDPDRLQVGQRITLPTPPAVRSAALPRPPRASWPRPTPPAGRRPRAPPRRRDGCDEPARTLDAGGGLRRGRRAPRRAGRFHVRAGSVRSVSGDRPGRDVRRRARRPPCAPRRSATA